jgi:hypothetical protein|tara:strand:- start:935 stop:1084 length:150 start_codon:yes stop_codon:yes gene_type:complete
MGFRREIDLNYSDLVPLSKNNTMTLVAATVIITTIITLIVILVDIKKSK